MVRQPSCQTVRLTSWIVARGEQNATRSLLDANDMAGSWSTQNAILAHNEFLHTICCSDLGNQLGHFRVPKSAVTTDDQGASLYTLWDRQ
jgi:hypothetical protein